jgi:hypothetical protein
MIIRATSEYYIEPNFSSLAGPFCPTSKTDQRYKSNVIADMKRGNIEWRIIKINGEEYIERRGMILPKRKA